MASAIHAWSDETGAGKRPGEGDPFAKNHTMLQNDSLIVIRHQKETSDMHLFGISPDKKVESNTKQQNINEKTIHFDDKKEVRHPVFGVIRDGENSPYLMRPGAGDTIIVSPAGALNVDFAAQQTFAAGIGEGGVTCGYAVADWDGDGVEDCFIIGVRADGTNFAQGMSGIAYDKKNNKWEQPKFGTPHQINSERVRAVQPTEYRCIVADVDDDGRKEIVLAYRGIYQEFLYYERYFIQVLRVVADPESKGAWKYKAVNDTVYYTDFYWGTYVRDTVVPVSKNRAMTFDISTGDVDKDGVDELLFACWAFEENRGTGYPRLQWSLLKYKDHKLNRMNAGAPIFSKDIFTTDHYLYMRAALADIDSDGRAEPVVLYMDDERDTYMGACKYDEKSDKNVFSRRLVSRREIRGLDMAAGNFTGELVPGAIGSNAAHIAVSIWNADDLLRTRLFIWDKEAKNFKENAGHYWDQSASCPPKDIFLEPISLVRADFRKESIQLGKPTHIVKENDQTTLVITQEPPKHVDYTIREGKKYAVVNLTRVPSYYTDFYKSDTTSEGLKTGQSTHAGSGVALDVSVKMGHKAKLKGVGGHDVGVDFQSSAEKGWKEKDEKIRESYKNSIKEIRSGTAGDDYVAYTLRTVDIWRYPIMGRHSIVSPDHGLWYSIAIPAPDQAKNFEGVATPGFQPTWCNGNILSYPRRASAIEDYLEENHIGGYNDFTIGRNRTSYAVGWSQEIKSTDVHTKSVSMKKDASLTLRAYAEYMGWYVDGKVSTKVKADSESTDATTATTSFNSKTNVKLEVSGTDFPDALNSSNMYTVKPIIYRSPGGALKVAYTVDIPDANMQWWKDRYASAPDPALNLPRVWVYRDRSWQKDEDSSSNPNARMIRGFFVAKEGTNLPSGIDETGTIDLLCRVHNFAMRHSDETDANARATAKDVKVKFEYIAMKQGKESGSRKLIKETTIPSIPVWNNAADEANWRYAAVSWDITNVPDGKYRVHVTVNSNKRIKELPYHGLGETYDNNRGWAEISLARPKRVTPEGTEAGDPDDADAFFEIGEVDLHLAGHRLSFDQDEDMATVALSIGNQGTSPALNVPVTLYRGGPDGTPIAQQILSGIFPDEPTEAWLRLPVDDLDDEDLTLVIGHSLGETDPSTNVAVIPGGKPDDDDDTDGSGGCSAGLGAYALLSALAALAATRRKNR